MAAGTLPAASAATTGVETLRDARCTTVPAVLEIAAAARSVPTATGAGMPNPPIRIGVMTEPAPTPVSPTIRPTESPMTVRIANSTMTWLQRFERAAISALAGESRASSSARRAARA